MSLSLAERVDVVIGVDTHTDTHTAGIVTSVGTVRAELTVPADDYGGAMVLAWAAQHTADQRRAWVIDGARSHGVGLLRVLRAAGEEVIDAPRVKGAARRAGGKSDSRDAIHAARVALGATRLATPREDGNREALRILQVTRRHLSDTRTATVNLFKSFILTADDDLRSQLRALTTLQQVRHCTHLTVHSDADTLTRIRHEQLSLLAVQITTLDQLLADNKKQLNALVKATCAPLLDQPGVGPVTAAAALIAWSHKGRFRSEAAFASLAGVSPIEASSGRIQRHRLNNRGDRTFNAAIHVIAMIRRRSHPTTRDYVTRRTTEGRSPKEINRCLKRYITRQLFRIMETTATA